MILLEPTPTLKLLLPAVVNSSAFEVATVVDVSAFEVATVVDVSAFEVATVVDVSAFEVAATVDVSAVLVGDAAFIHGGQCLLIIMVLHCSYFESPPRGALRY